ncbi:terminase large subunit domain-containing protein [Candidatus Nitrospira bockiana]
MAIIQLTKYQQASARVKARFRLKRWCRQSGKTFEETREIADDAHGRRTGWVILSRGERQSKANIEQTALHCKAYGAAATPLEDTWEGEHGKYKSLRIDLPNGSWIMGLPANPDTARGFSANVYLDEFAFHKDSRKIWTALFPIITRGYQLRITSTPQGKQNKFYDLDTDWSKKAKDDPRYHTSKLDIFDAVAGGLELRDEEGRLTTPEDLRAAMGDDDAFDQEYLVLYIDEATAFLSYELIASCEDPELAATAGLAFKTGGTPEMSGECLWAPVLFEKAIELYQLYLATKLMPPAVELLDPTVINAEALYLGMDIGRKRDLSEIWLNRDKDGTQETVVVITMKRTPFFIQRAVLFSLLAHPMLRRACLDQSGLGLQLTEEAIERFGATKVEGIDFTTANKELLATGCKQKMEDTLVRIPAEVAIRNSLHSVRKYGTGTGHFRFDAERTDKTGHADKFWALALALHAASASGPPAAVATQEPTVRDVREDRGRVLVGGGMNRWRQERSRIWTPTGRG